MMNRSTNHKIFIGRMTVEPELKAGKKCEYSRFALEAERELDGEWKTVTMECVAFSKQAHILCQYLRKGKLLAVEGRYETKPQPRNGIKFPDSILIAEKLTWCEDRNLA